MKLTTLEKWYAIKSHAEAIVEHARIQTEYGSKIADAEDRVSGRAERIKVIAELIGTGE